MRDVILEAAVWAAIVAAWAFFFWHLFWGNDRAWRRWHEYLDTLTPEQRDAENARYDRRDQAQLLG